MLAEFQVQLAKHREKTKQDDNILSVHEKFRNFANYIRKLGNDCSEKGQGYQNSTEEWFTPEIKDIVDKKAKAYVQWQQHRDTHVENKHRNHYRTLAKLVKNKVEARQREYWEERSVDIENAVKDHDPTTAFQIIRRLRGNRVNTEHIAIHDKDGNVLNNNKERLKRWRKYFDEMFNVHTSVDEKTLQQIPTPLIDQKELSRQDAVPIVGEVVRAIQQIKNRRAPGKDEVTAELIKAGGLPLAEWLHEIIRDV